jgi:DNA-binding response OmpR family regulator
MAKEKIVVIDDSPIVRKLAELALEEEGYKVYTAEDGEEGLRISEEVRPSVILVDFIMPRMSGYQFCKSARENELLKDIPIILITGKGEDVGKKFAEKFAVDDYFIKPFKSEMLVEKVNSIVNAQRQRMGEEPAFDTFEKPSEEAPAYSFEGVAAAVVPQYEVHELTEVPEPAEMSEALSEFDHPAEETGIHREVELSGIQEVEAAPGLSFDDLATLEEPQPSFQGGMEEVEGTPVFSFDDLVTLEEPQPSIQGGMEEVGLGVSSFDFNLEGLATQQIEGQEGERIEAPPEFPEVFDFEAVQELKEMPPAEVMMEPVPLAFAGGDLANRANTENAVDRIMGRYFSDELPLLIERSIEDILKRYSIIKPSTILLSGSLREIGSVEIFKLIDSSRLTGKFFAFAPACSAEIYFDKGLVVYALASTDRRTATLKRGFIDETGEGLSDRMSETLSMVANLKDGGFFFERMAMPPALLDMPQRMNVVALLLHGMRRKESGSAESVIGNSLVFIKKVGDIKDFGLDDQEQKVFSLVDGVRNMVDNAELSGFGMAEAKKILHRLVQVGILSNKGGF